MADKNSFNIYFCRDHNVKLFPAQQPRHQRQLGSASRPGATPLQRSTSLPIRLKAEAGRTHSNTGLVATEQKQLKLAARNKQQNPC